jgi:anti-sigma factor RsiW
MSQKSGGFAIIAAADINETMKRRRSSSGENRVGSSSHNKASRRRARPLTCAKETALIADYLASDLSPGNLAAFEKHLEECPDCKAFLQTYKKTIEITRSFLALESVKARPSKPALRPANRRYGRD